MKIYGHEVAVNEKGKVEYAVSKDGQRTVYPYKWSKYGGWDNCSGEYTPEQLRRKIKNETACFR